MTEGPRTKTERTRWRSGSTDYGGDLAGHFDAVVAEVDVDAISEHDPRFDEIPPDAASEKVRAFVLELDGRDLVPFDCDVIAAIGCLVADAAATEDGADDRDDNE